MKYREDTDKTKEVKQNYQRGFEELIDQRNKEFEAKRSEYSKNIFKNPDAYREDLKRMLGWPLVDSPTEELPAVKLTELSREDGYTIYRITFQLLGTIEFTGLYFESDASKPLPLVIAEHGKFGTPERISGIYGETFNYNDMLTRIKKQGVNVFAPQLLLWDEKYGVPFNREETDARLKRVGSSVVAVELYCLSRTLDYFEAKGKASSFGMVGLSYGGFYTLLLSAIDTRIKSAISCSYFNTKDKVAFPDWCWDRSAERFDDAEIACLVYPRKLCIEIGTNDPLFDYRYGVRSYEKIKDLCKSVGTDWISFITFDGNHEFCRDNEPIERLAEDLKD